MTDLTTTRPMPFPQINADHRRCLDRIRCFLLDIDGTICLSGQPLPGAELFLRRLRETGRSYFYFTNNSSESGEECRAKLAAMEIDAKTEEIVTSGQAAIHYLREEYPGKKVYLLGGDGLKREFRANGVEVVEDNPDVVVTALDFGLDYRRLSNACLFVQRGLPYIGTHSDRNFPTDAGLIPDLGATHAFVHAATGRWPDKTVGKPDRVIIDYALTRAGVTAGQTAVVGDRLYTDIASGVLWGMTGILVLTGEAKESDLADTEFPPHLVFDSVAQITPLL